MTTSNPTPVIHTLLVANRGEIARRVFRTARDMGIRCVAVYVDADTDAPFVTEADEAHRLHNGYLDGDSIIAAALASRAQAVHPGYGFLAENADFATAVIAAGLIWVGPTPEVIATMGDKLAAKKAAVDAGVATLPSSHDTTAAQEIGYPLIIKAAAGGGGKGMHIVESADLLDGLVTQARREALHSFGNDTVFLERYIANAHHVEIQILGDGHGNVIHLGERECSIQRRHQKIIEESPSPIVDDLMRAAMGKSALELASAIGYQSAGTVEFLVDDLTKEFWFLEVNTRLQVEHPVTEMVTGVDLVREQLRVAAGEPLEIDQDSVTFTGHAIEARLYAEDPAANFLPATGTLRAWQPADEPSVRWDSGVTEGSVVGVDFDPMLAKVIASGPTRTEAAGRLALALERFHIAGLTTNRDFLAAVLRSPEFLAGETTTDFIQRVMPPGRPAPDPEHDSRLAVAASMWLQAQNHAEAVVLPNIRSGFVLGRVPAQQVTWTIDSRELTVRYKSQRDGTFVIGDDPNDGVATVHSWAPDHIDIEWQDHRCRYLVTRHGLTLHLSDGRGTTDLHQAPRFIDPGSDTSSGGLVAPMPGVVLEVRVSPGDVVSAGQTLVVLEAMKMEHHMNAPSDGVVAEVLAKVGVQVENGEPLVVFESDLTEED